MYDMSVDNLLMELAAIVNKMRTVKTDDYVESTDTNLFVEYCETALQLIQALYEKYKSKTGKTIPKVEEMIELATGRAAFLRTVKFGDMVTASDHTTIIDILKCIDIALIELLKALE